MGFLLFFLHFFLGFRPGAAESQSGSVAMPVRLHHSQEGFHKRHPSWGESKVYHKIQSDVCPPHYWPRVPTVWTTTKESPLLRHRLGYIPPKHLRGRWTPNWLLSVNVNNTAKGLGLGWAASNIHLMLSTATPINSLINWDPNVLTFRHWLIITNIVWTVSETPSNAWLQKRRRAQ